MSGISITESTLIGICLEGFFCGLYSGIFVMYIQLQTLKQASDKMNNIIFYALCALYILSVGNVIVNTSVVQVQYFIFEPGTALHLYLIGGAVAGLCDFIAQSILIYRCWIVWGRNIRVIIPSILVFTFLATWIAVEGSTYIFQDMLLDTHWGIVLALTSFVISLTVNALVTGLIVFRISKVYREIKLILGGRDLGVAGGRKLRSVIFIIIESGMALISIQLVQIVLYILLEDSMLAREAYKIILGIRQMLNGITPTIILVRVSMGLSFHDKESMMESITEDLHFVAENLTGHHESRGGLDDIDVHLSNDPDIQIVDG